MKRLHIVTRLLAMTTAALIGVCVAASAPAAVPQTSPVASVHRHTPFTEALFRNWAAWDTNHDDVLSAEEVDHAVADPAVKGDDAAAAAAIKLLLRTPRIPGPLSRAWFMGYEAAALRSAPAKASGDNGKNSDAIDLPETPRGHGASGHGRSSAARGDQIAAGAKFAANFDLYFSRCRRRIARGRTGPVWPELALASVDAGRPRAIDDSRSFADSLDHMSQGPIGDCFFIATIGSAIVHRPALRGELVEPLPDGRFRARFPGADPFTFAAPTDGQLAISSSAAGDGAWLAVLEQAFGKYRAALKGGSPDADGTDVLRRGGDSGVVIRLLTGHATRRITLPASVEGRAARKDDLLPELRQALRESIDAHRLITCGIDPPTELKPGPDGKPAGALPGLPPGLQKRHVYAVVGYDPATDVVEIWNPHGQAFQPKGEPSPGNGYVTLHGRFRLPLSEAYGIWTSFTFELDRPAPTRGAKHGDDLAPRRPAS